jgi:hypothetical protein
MNTRPTRNSRLSRNNVSAPSESVTESPESAHSNGPPVTLIGVPTAGSDGLSASDQNAVVPHQQQKSKSGISNDGDSIERTCTRNEDGDVGNSVGREHDTGDEISNADKCSTDSAAGTLAAFNLERERCLHERFPKAEFIPEKDFGIAHCVWSDLDLRLNHFDCLSEYQKYLLNLVYRKVNYDRCDGTPSYWKNQKDWKKYDARATILALSKPPGARRILSAN